MSFTFHPLKYADGCQKTRYKIQKKEVNVEDLSDVSQGDEEDDWVEEETERVVETEKEGEDETESVRVMPGP